MKKIYLGLTTTWGSDWRQKTREIDELALREVALFLSAVELKERKELYSLISKSGLKRAPFVHLRTDMERWEVDFLIEKYGAKVFNIHPSVQALEFLKTNHDLAGQIFVENCLSMDYFEETLKICGGICLDTSHYEDFALRQHYPGQDQLLELLKKYPVGCTHIPAIRAEKYQATTHGKSFMVYESHTMNDIHEMDYIKSHQQYLGDFNAIELNNSLAEQLVVKSYLEKLLSS